tara:strand:+ start:517 stop:1155 length:639 start_codon:yes stop_codon:yes gene_type:complete
MQKKSIEKKFGVSLTEASLQPVIKKKLEECFCINYVARDDYVGETVETSHDIRNVFSDEWGNTYVILRESISSEDSEGSEIEKNNLLMLRFFLDSDDYTIIDSAPYSTSNPSAPKVPQTPKKRERLSDYEICSRYTLSVKQDFGNHGVDLKECETKFHRNEDDELIIEVSTHSNSKMKPTVYKTNKYKVIFKKDLFTGDYVGIGMSGIEFIS